MKQVLEFLYTLRENNNREWFNDNRKLYEESREKMLFVTEILIGEVRKFDNDIPVMNPKDCLFRIFRDVRFSNDKRPYKTNMGSFIAKGGRKSERAGYYFHIEPDGHFIGGGIYMPQSNQLKAIRSEIYEHPKEYLKIISDKKFKKYFNEYEGEKLKTAPKGFSKDFEHIDLIRPKSYAYGHNVGNDIILGDKFIGYTVDVYKELFVLNRFLNESLNKFL